MCGNEIRAYMLYSSSKGNVAYLKCGSDEILIDAGVSARRICSSLEEIGTSIKNIKAIFITHEHNDHIGGLQTLTKYYKIPVYAPYLSARYIAGCQPETAEVLCDNDDGNCVELDNISVHTVGTPHDSLASVGFRIELGDKTFGYATDIGYMSENVANMLTGCDYVVVESNHDIDMLRQGEYPYYLKQRILGKRGHLSNKACADFLPELVEKGAKSIVLAHLSENNNRPQIAYGECRGKLASCGISVSVNGSCGDVTLAVAAPACQVRIV